MTTGTLPVRSLLALLACLLAPAASALEPPGYERDLRAYNLAHGRVIFSKKCVHCHAADTSDAPTLGQVDDWAPRLQQPLTTLIAHAIGGHGKMPPKGDLDLSDQEVAAAVAYVVHQGRLITGNLDRLAATTAGGADTEVLDGAAPDQARIAANADPADAVILNMLLLLMSQERWK